MATGLGIGNPFRLAEFDLVVQPAPKPGTGGAAATMTSTSSQPRPRRLRSPASTR
jgi:hypothetical protein